MSFRLFSPPIPLNGIEKRRLEMSHLLSGDEKDKEVGDTFNSVIVDVLNGVPSFQQCQHCVSYLKSLKTRLENLNSLNRIRGLR